jgi:predicted nucleic-acid-binding Zn-ribbon protein
MKNGTCPKCNSEEVYFSESRFTTEAVSITLTTNALFANYVCLNCGFNERYISDETFRTTKDTIRKKWKKVK